jgi:hypothetical protein
MLQFVVKEADIDRIAVPEGYEVLDATALGERLGSKRATVLSYMSRRYFGLIPKPNRQLAMGPVWFERTVEEWGRRKDG